MIVTKDKFIKAMDNIEFLKVKQSNSLPHRIPKKFITLNNKMLLVSPDAKKISECSVKSAITQFSLNKTALEYTYMAMYYDKQTGNYFYGLENRELKFEEDSQEEYEKKIKLSEDHIGVFDGEVFIGINDINITEGVFDYLILDYKKNEEKLKLKAVRKAIKESQEKTKAMKFISKLYGEHEKENWNGIVL